MKAYEAWFNAKVGQNICRVGRPHTVFEKVEVDYGVGRSINIERAFGVDFSADDWEVAKEVKTATATRVQFVGREIGGCSKELMLTDDFLKSHNFTKVTFEWEE